MSTTNWDRKKPHCELLCLCISIVILDIEITIRNFDLQVLTWMRQFPIWFNIHSCLELVSATFISFPSKTLFTTHRYNLPQDTHVSRNKINTSSIWIPKHLGRQIICNPKDLEFRVPRNCKSFRVLQTWCCDHLDACRSFMQAYTTSAASRVTSPLWCVFFSILSKISSSASWHLNKFIKQLNDQDLKCTILQ